MSTPNNSVSIGTITTPPPSPVSAPSRPAVNEPPAISSVNSRMDMEPMIPCHPRKCSAVRHGTLVGRRHQALVLGKHPAGVTRLRLLPGGLAPGELRIRHVHLDQLFVRGDGDAIAFLDQGDRAAVESLGGNMADDQAL